MGSTIVCQDRPDSEDLHPMQSLNQNSSEYRHCYRSQVFGVRGVGAEFCALSSEHGNHSCCGCHYLSVSSHCIFDVFNMAYCFLDIFKIIALDRKSSVKIPK